MPTVNINSNQQQYATGSLTGQVVYATGGEALGTVSVYDQKGQVVRSVRKGLGGHVEDVHTAYSFTGAVDTTWVDVSVGYGGSLTAETVYTYSKGKKTKTKYTGKDALFQSYPFSYYRLSEAPAVYKELGWDSAFVPMQGPVIAVAGKLSVVSDPHVQVCLSVEGVGDVLSELQVNAAVLVGSDGTRVGMKHLENIWLKTFFGFNLDSEAYALLKGKRIESVELYTHEAKYVIGAEDAVTID